MVCENCGKELVKVGALTEEELRDFCFVNEKFATANQALNSNVIKDIKFTDGQVFEYFKAGYDQLAQARYLQFIFERELKNRLNVSQDTPIVIDGLSREVFVHPNCEENQ
jgi:hypothetical protein